MEMLAKFTHKASDLLVAVSAAGLVLMTAIVGWQVFGRYVLNASPSWSEQASLTLMIWYILFAAAAGVREGFHIRIVTVEQSVPPKLGHLMRVLSNLVVMFCGMAMVIWGGALVSRTWAHTIPSLGIPRGVAYLGLPIAGALIALFAFEHVLTTLQNKPVKTEENT
ncbi:MAG: TRAP transporter permease DctQ [Robiginitomaculum sp.]|nr:MAG: TRAP transporter permease DctQ [Robiginitomaculum sp.]